MENIRQLQMKDIAETKQNKTNWPEVFKSVKVM